MTNNCIIIQKRRYTKSLIKMWEPTETHTSIKKFGITLILNASGTLKRIHYFDQERERDEQLIKIDDFMGLVK